MNGINKVGLLAEIQNDHCHLNHGPGVDISKIPANNCIILPIGYKKSQPIETDVVVRELIIPICHDCADALQCDEWTLLYCLECCSSRWVCRQLAKNRYRHHILWLKGCPDCTGQFGGLYFNDGLDKWEVCHYGRNIVF